MTSIYVKTNMKEVGLRIRSLRLGYSQTVEEVAKIIKVSPNIIKKWESGYFHITKNEAEDLAHVYGIPSEWILEGKNENGIVQKGYWEEQIIQEKTSRYIKDCSLVTRISPISKRYRKENFLTRKQLALLSGVSETSIRRIEQMKPVADYCVIKVAKVVDVYTPKKQEIMGVNSETVNALYDMQDFANTFKQDFEKVFGVSQDNISVSIKL